VSLCGVRLSVTFVYSETFFTSGRFAILVFPYQTLWQYSEGNPLKGTSNTGGVRKIVAN